MAAFNIGKRALIGIGCTSRLSIAATLVASEGQCVVVDTGDDDRGDASPADSTGPPRLGLESESTADAGTGS